MTEAGISHIRKLVSVVVALTALQVLKAYGLDMGELTAFLEPFGLNPQKVSDQIAEGLVTVILAAVAVYFPPNNPGVAATPEGPLTRQRRTRRLLLAFGALAVLVVGVGMYVWLT